MNTMTTEHPLDQHHQPAPPLRPLSTADRLALHLGVALIRWSERPRTPRYRRSLSHEELQRARQELEVVTTRAAEHDLLMMRVR
jgi:hypothetical protein